MDEHVVAVKRALPAPEACERAMNKHLAAGIIAGIVFTFVIVWGAVVLRAS